MATRKQFCAAMEEVYKNHGVYIGTANGEFTESLTIGKIHQMEKNYGRSDPDNDTKRDLKYIASCYEKHYDMSKSRAGDCSGIIVGVMRDLKIIKPTSDYSAKMFQKEAKPVGLNDLQAGDLVFDKTSNASHVGVYVGDGYVIESKGRDYGVVKRPRKDGSWVVGGRLDWFDDDDDKVLTRVLKYVPDNLMRGDDVKEVQKQLALEGYNCGTIDGVFGTKTRQAVTQFQYESGLECDGVVGKKTAEALGFKWEG